MEKVTDLLVQATDIDSLLALFDLGYVNRSLGEHCREWGTLTIGKLTQTGRESFGPDGDFPAGFYV